MMAFLAPLLAKTIGGVAVKWLACGAIALGLASGIYFGVRHAISEFEASVRAETVLDLGKRQAEAVAQARLEEAARVEALHAEETRALARDRDEALTRAGQSAAALATLRERIAHAPPVDRDRLVGPVLRAVLDCLRYQDATGAAACGGDADGARGDPGPAPGVPRAPDRAGR
jgi:hypothetical protein